MEASQKENECRNSWESQYPSTDMYFNRLKTLIKAPDPMWALAISLATGADDTNPDNAVVHSSLSASNHNDQSHAGVAVDAIEY